MFCFHCFTANLTPWSRFSRKSIIYKFNYELFLFCFFPLNWSKANTINVIKPEKSGKEVISLKITHCVGCIGGIISWSNSENAFTDTWLWRKSFSARSMSLKWKPTEGLSGEPGQNWHLTKVTAWLSQSHTATSLRCWLPGHEKKNKFIRIGRCVVCTYQLLYDNVNYTCIFIGSQPRATIPSSVWFVINYKIFLMGSTKIKLF